MRRQGFTQHDGLLYEERYNLLNAFFATVPGNRQFNLRKQWALTFIFDLGGSYETLTRAFGGSYLNVGLKNPGFSTNPFSLEPAHENLNFLYCCRFIAASLP